MPDLGLTVPASKILDPVLFREAFFWGLVLGYPVEASQYRVDITRPREVDRLITPQTKEELKRLFGNVPNHVVELHLRAALSNLCTKIGIDPTVRKIVMRPFDDDTGSDYDEIGERLHFSRTNQQATYRLELGRPVASVSRVRIVVAEQVYWTSASDDVTITDGKSGVIHVNFQTVPVALITTRDIMQVDDNLARSATRMQGYATVRDFWAIDYTTGSLMRGKLGHLPMAALYWVWCQACRYLLSLYGAVQSRGISSQSRSIDGISVSLGLTASAMYGVYSATEVIAKQYCDDIDWKSLTRATVGIPLAMY